MNHVIFHLLILELLSMLHMSKFFLSWLSFPSSQRSLLFVVQLMGN